MYSSDWRVRFNQSTELFVLYREEKFEKKIQISRENISNNLILLKKIFFSSNWK